MTVALLVMAVSQAADAAIHTFGDTFNYRIPADPEWTWGWMQDAVIDVPAHMTISDLDIEINISHSSVFDLQIYLQSPAGTRILLNFYDFDRGFFEGSDYVETVFDDEAPVPIENAQSPFTGRFRPREPYLLSAFDGQDAFGTWRLQINDAFLADSGTLESVHLLITVPEPSTAAVLTFGTGALIMLKRGPRKRNLRA
jgi:hypothetical protein